MHAIIVNSSTCYNKSTVTGNVAIAFLTVFNPSLYSVLSWWSNCGTIYHYNSRVGSSSLSPYHLLSLIQQLYQPKSRVWSPFIFECVFLIFKQTVALPLASDCFHYFLVINIKAETEISCPEILQVTELMPLKL